MVDVIFLKLVGDELTLLIFCRNRIELA